MLIYMSYFVIFFIESTVNRYIFCVDFFICFLLEDHHLHISNQKKCGGKKMKDYDENYFWTTTDPITFEKKYYFKLNKMMIEVTKEVYQVCFNSYRKSLRDIEKEEDVSISSLDSINKEAHSLHDVIPGKANTSEEAYQHMRTEELYSAIHKLNDEEKQIILEILMEDKSVRQLAFERNIPYMTMKRKKDRILKKLKNILEKW